MILDVISALKKMLDKNLTIQEIHGCLDIIGDIINKYLKPCLDVEDYRFGADLCRLYLDFYEKEKLVVYFNRKKQGE